MFAVKASLCASHPHPVTGAPGRRRVERGPHPGWFKASWVDVAGDSRVALVRVLDAFKDQSKHLPPDSPAFRTVMNFLERI